MRETRQEYVRRLAMLCRVGLTLLVLNRYKFQHINFTMKALSVATKVVRPVFLLPSYLLSLLY